MSWTLDVRKLTSQYIAHHWSMDDGVTDNYIQAIFQSADGYLWLGTKNGVIRFDGVLFTAWPPGTTVGEGVSVRSLCQTSDGSLWAGTDGHGLWRIRGREIIRYGRNDGLPGNHVRALLEDREGTLWLALEGNGLARWKAGHFAPVQTPEDGPAGLVELFEDSQGGIWLAGDGLWHFKDGQFANVKKRFGFSQERFRSVCEDPDGSIWVGTSRGLLRLQGSNVTRFLEADGLSDDQIVALSVDRDGNLWIGSNSGLDRFKDGKFARCLTRENATYDLVYSLFEDREGNLWIGTNGGLTRLRDDKFSNLTTKDGLVQNLVAAAVEAPDGAVWVATWTRGVARLKDEQTTIFDQRAGLPGDSMRCIHADRHGTVWAGTEQGGLSRIDGETITTIGSRGALQGRQVAAVQDDPEGHLWVLTEEGLLFRYRDGAFTPLPPNAGLLGTRIQAIHAGMGNNFWAATEAGLNRRRRGQWTGYAYPDPMAGVSVRSLFEDQGGNLWLCLVGGGLARFRDGQFVVYRASQGLFDDNPYAAIEDNRENLWIASKKGVFRINREDFIRLDRGEIQRLTCVSFDEGDGMGSRRCSKVGFPLATKLRDGRLCFPTNKGLAIVDPENLPHNPIVPSLVIDGIVLDRHRFWPDQIHRVPAGTREVEIHYSTISLRAPEKVQFKYRLEGYDEDWIDAKNGRVAHYQHLPPGNYRFQVIATNEDGVWNRNGASISFSKKPFIYQTAWFYGSCGLLVAASAGLLHWRRIHRTRTHFAALLDERTRIARDLHDTLEQGLVGISMQLNLAETKYVQAPAAAHKHLEKARYMLRHCMADARSTILNLRNQRTKDLLAEFSRIADELGGNSVQLIAHARGTPVALTPFAQDTLIRIGQEAMTNVIKHAQARTIRVDLSFESQKLVLRIQDDGRGFDLASINGGNHERFGLLGMRERTEKLGGELMISSAPGQGTTIQVVAPAREAVRRN